MRVLVTGCAGFIGSHLTEALVRRGHEVVGLDSFDDHYPPALKRANLRGLQGCAAFRLVEADVRDAKAVGALVGEQQPEAILHLAARVGVRPSFNDPVGYESVNAGGTVVLLEAARRHGVGRFILASSSSVYGDDSPVPFREDQPLTSPISPYAASKIAAEAHCRAFHRAYALPVVVLRFFTVYGPRQRPDLAISKFCHLMRAGRPIPLYGDGTSSRDYTYVDDIVAGVLAALDADLQGETINLGGSHPVELRELVAALERVLNCPAQIERLPEQPGDLRCTFADIQKARRLLGWAPTVTLEEGLARYADWVAKQEAEVS